VTAAASAVEVPGIRTYGEQDDEDPEHDDRVGAGDDDDDDDEHEAIPPPYSSLFSLYCTMSRYEAVVFAKRKMLI
jgi:hypothetical protein